MRNANPDVILFLIRAHQQLSKWLYPVWNPSHLFGLGKNEHCTHEKVTDMIFAQYTFIEINLDRQEHRMISTTATQTSADKFVFTPDVRMWEVLGMHI